jgi:hypothetical protein
VFPVLPYKVFDGAGNPPTIPRLGVSLNKKREQLDCSMKFSLNRPEKSAFID